MQKEHGALFRALAMDGQVSVAVLNTTALAKEAGERHKLKEGSLSVLSKTLTAAGYLCGWLKGERSSLTVSIASEGDFGKINVLGDGNLNLRGYIENRDCARGRLKSGSLSVIRDDGERLPFSGTIPLRSEEIEENFSAYFSESEQIPTGIALVTVLNGTKVVCAGGVFLQALPFASEKARSFVDGGAGQFEKYLIDGEFHRVFQELGVQKIETREMRFVCRCSFKRAESLLLSMGKEDALALLKEEGRILVHCEYCNADYIFDEVGVRKLFD